MYVIRLSIFRQMEIDFWGETWTKKAKDINLNHGSKSGNATKPFIARMSAYQSFLYLRQFSLNSNRKKRIHVLLPLGKRFTCSSYVLYGSLENKGFILFLQPFLLSEPCSKEYKNVFYNASPHNLLKLGSLLLHISMFIYFTIT